MTSDSHLTARPDTVRSHSNGINSSGALAWEHGPADPIIKRNYQRGRELKVLMINRLNRTVLCASLSCRHIRLYPGVNLHTNTRFQVAVMQKYTSVESSLLLLLSRTYLHIFFTPFDFDPDQKYPEFPLCFLTLVWSANVGQVLKSTHLPTSTKYLIKKIRTILFLTSADFVCSEKT